jgi:hypothetical protein
MFKYFSTLASVVVELLSKYKLKNISGARAAPWQQKMTIDHAIICNFFPMQAEWKGINRKQSTRWQHLSRLKASAFFSLQKN